jgi:asparagine synthase (glutamine-hydrolysing)
MCGINGKITTKQDSINHGLIEEMNQEISYRGPDAQGVEVFKNEQSFIGLGHQRLKIIDLSNNANQPFYSEDKNIILVFNGEIYNFQRLKQEHLRDEQFQTNSDTEVIIKMYQKFGIGFVEKLIGMFAIALYDKKLQKLFLIRDHLGKKPLFYYKDDNSLIFSSQIRPILKSNEVKKELNLTALNDYFSFNYIFGENTIYQKIKKLPPATYLEYHNNEITIKQYWDLPHTVDKSITEEDALKKCEDLIKDSINLRLISDVPLGAFLSGGIDSSLIVAMMAEKQAKVKTFSIGFEESDFNELAYAKIIADQYKTEHYEFIVKPNAFEIIDDLLTAYDEPYADPSQIPMYYLSKFTKEKVTVALNGDGGDEAFAGYERYKGMIYQSYYRYIPKPLRYAIYQLIKNIPENTQHTSLIRQFKWLNRISLKNIDEAYLKAEKSFRDKEKKLIYQENMKIAIDSGIAIDEFKEK